MLYTVVFHLDLWLTCVDIFFHKGLTILSADDDQLQLKCNRGSLLESIIPESCMVHSRMRGVNLLLVL